MLVDIVEVEAEIDWRRRFDHMQQHSGQHLISVGDHLLTKLHFYEQYPLICIGVLMVVKVSFK